MANFGRVHHAAAACLAAAAWLGGEVSAGLIVDKVGFVNGGENVLNGSGVGGLTLSATTNKGTPVVLSQPVLPLQPNLAELIVAPSSGQARVVSASADKLFSSLRIALGGGLGFTAFEANAVFAVAGVPFTVSAFSAAENLLVSKTFFSSDTGQNPFGALASGTTVISYVDIVGPLNSLSSVAQIRFDGVRSIPEPATPAEVPEPSSLALLGLLGGVGAVARWRKKRKTVAATAA